MNINLSKIFVFCLLSPVLLGLGIIQLIKFGLDIADPPMDGASNSLGGKCLRWAMFVILSEILLVILGKQLVEEGLDYLEV